LGAGFGSLQYLPEIELSSMLRILCLFLILIPFWTKAQHDTLYVCEPGQPLQLQADPDFIAYRWSPATYLDNPTVANPIVRPLESTTYIVEAIAPTTVGENLIENADFSMGNVGFSSAYQFVTAINTQGTYGVDDSPADMNATFFSPCEDHTDGTGLMMVVDGSPQANTEVWCQTIDVEPNQNYAFSTWVTSIFRPNPARLQFSINGIQLGEVFNAGNDVCEWRQFYETWGSGQNTTAEICIVNQNTNPQGNDFALDDFAFFELGETVYDTFTVLVQDTTFLDTTACASDSVLFKDQWIPAGVTARFTYISNGGCDSVVVLTVNVLDTLFEEIRVDTLCPGDVLDFRGNRIDRDTTLCVTFPISTSCDSTICLTAVFLTETALTAERSPPSCHGFSDGEIQIQPQAGLPPYDFQWSNGGENATNPNLSAGSYSVTVFDAKGCSASRSFELSEPPPLEPQLTAESTLCNGQVDATIFVDAKGGTPPYLFAPNGTAFQGLAQVQDVQPGVYTFPFQDANGCQIVDSVTVPEPPPLELQVPDPVGLTLGDSLSVVISDNASRMLNYHWMPEAGVRCPSCAATSLRPFETTNYTITAIDENGCSVQAQWLVEVQRDQAVFVPNAFSPNGDGYNDRFEIFTGQSVEQLVDFQVFDRWGNLQFEAQNCNKNCSWDGTARGEKMESGVYVYAVKVSYLDGFEEIVTGDVLLIR